MVSERMLICEWMIGDGEIWVGLAGRDRVDRRF